MSEEKGSAGSGEQGGDKGDSSTQAAGSSSKTKKARALVDCTIEGKAYKASQLVIASAKAIDSAEKEGTVDSNKDAVAVADVVKDDEAE